jgi:hypothetical protein
MKFEIAQLLLKFPENACYTVAGVVSRFSPIIMGTHGEFWTPSPRPALVMGHHVALVAKGRGSYLSRRVHFPTMTACYTPFVNLGRSSMSQRHPPTKCSTVCPFGLIFDSDETSQCAHSIHAIADGPPRNSLGWSCLQLVLRGFPRIRCEYLCEWSCREHVKVQADGFVVIMLYFT